MLPFMFFAAKVCLSRAGAGLCWSTCFVFPEEEFLRKWDRGIAAALNCLVPNRLVEAKLRTLEHLFICTIEVNLL